MAIQQKEMADVAPNNGYSRAQYTATDFSPLAQGIQSFGRDLGEAIRRSKVAENVQLVVNQGLREMQEVTAEYNALKGEMGWSQQVFDQYQDKLKRIFEKRMADARTDDGRDEIMARLDAYRTQSYGNMYQTHLQRVDAKFISDTNAELAFAENNIRSSSDAETFQFNLHNVMASLNTLADHQGLSDRQRQNLFQDAQNKMLLSAMQGIQGRDTYDNSTYEEAKNFLEFARQTYGSTGASSEEGQQATGSGGAFDVMAKIVDSLKRRQSASQIALEFQRKHGREALANAIIYGNKKSKLYQEAVQLAKDNRIELQELLGAAQHHSGRVLHQQAQANTNSIDNAWSLYHDINAEWMDSRVQAIYKQLDHRAAAGDADAEQKRRLMASWWDQKAANDARGRDIPTPEQQANLLRYVRNWANTTWRTSSSASVDSTLQMFLTGQLHHSQWPTIIGLSKSNYADALQLGKWSPTTLKDSFSFLSEPLVKAIHKYHGAQEGSKNDSNAAMIERVVSDVTKKMLLDYNIAAQNDGFVSQEKGSEIINTGLQTLYDRLNETRSDEGIFVQWWKGYDKKPLPKPLPANSYINWSSIKDALDNYPLFDSNGDYRELDSKGRSVVDLAARSTVGVFGTSTEPVFRALATHLQSIGYRNAKEEFPEIFGNTEKDASGDRRQKAINSAFNDFCKKNGLDPNGSDVYSKISSNTQLRNEWVEIVKGIK